MSRVTEAYDLIIKAAEELGPTELARRAGLKSKTTVTQLLDEPKPKRIVMLEQLEAAAQAHADEQRAKWTPVGGVPA